MPGQKKNREEAMVEWKKGRDNHSSLLLRTVELELQTPTGSEIVILQAYRIWEKPEGKTGFQLTDSKDCWPSKWKWYPANRILSMTVEPIRSE